jgi:DNA-binding Xre family transcriptional regulator
MPLPVDPLIIMLDKAPNAYGTDLLRLEPSPMCSSKRLITFLTDTGLHKKDFAEMIGVTLSYVYSLMDTTMSFSTRITTLERIAVVMSTQPETFAEYKPTDEPRIIDPGIQFLQAKQAQLGLSNLQFLKRCPRSRRVQLVDLWRGVLPLPLNWSELLAIGLVLDLTAQDIYPFWETRMRQYLHDGGLDPIANQALTQTLMTSARKHLNT